MKKLAIIHTVNWYNKSVIEPFANPWLKENPDVEIINIMDDSLLSESLPYGGPTKEVIRRMILYYQAAEATDADVLMCSCTTMGPGTRIARQMINKPVFNIDEPMAKEAVAKGKKLGILATVPTNAPATRTLLEMEAAETRKHIEIKSVINEPAFSAFTQWRSRTAQRTCSPGMHKLLIWENISGDGSEWKENLILEGKRVHEALGADADGDGDIDILSKPWHGDLHFYLENKLKN
ncbi:MAG TPA: aspartate/glutamate racemase family protein [Draconibacterium sp.]|nr:aspartate/glutamate racemase family protein [Draconibacterium sp.]